MLPRRLRAAVDRLGDRKLDTPYRDGGWSVRQLVRHVGDRHMNCYVRFRLALTEDWPTIKPYDEAAWAELLDRALPVEPSLVLIDKLHQRWVALLEAIDEPYFARGFLHPARGRQNLGTTLAL
jgi:DinB family protein